MLDIKNKFYLSLNDNEKENFTILFEIGAKKGH